MMSPPVVHIIDDDEPVRSALRFGLEVQGHEVETYVDAADFLARLPANGGVLLCDIRMPGMNGIELTRLLVDQPGFELVIILVTGHADNELKVDALRAGAAALLEKPLSLPQLIAEITRVTAGWP